MVAKVLATETARGKGAADADALVRDQAEIKGSVSLPGSLVEPLPDMPFSELCNSGSAITSRNFLVKLWRYCIAPLKQLYLPFITNNMPTNYLMVSCSPDDGTSQTSTLVQALLHLTAITASVAWHSWHTISSGGESQDAGMPAPGGPVHNVLELVSLLPCLTQLLPLPAADLPHLQPRL